MTDKKHPLLPFHRLVLRPVLRLVHANGFHSVFFTCQIRDWKSPRLFEDGLLRFECKDELYILLYMFSMNLDETCWVTEHTILSRQVNCTCRDLYLYNISCWLVCLGDKLTKLFIFFFDIYLYWVTMLFICGISHLGCFQHLASVFSLILGQKN